MPKCRNCGQRLSRLDKEICPFCGEKNPLEGIDDSTIDITKTLETIDANTIEKVKNKSKVFAAILAFIFGFLGIHFLYLQKYKNFLITLIVNICIIGIVGLILFLTKLITNVVLAFLIPYFAIEIYMIIFGILLIVRHDITDGRGEFLK